MPKSSKKKSKKSKTKQQRRQQAQPKMTVAPTEPQPPIPDPLESAVDAAIIEPEAADETGTAVEAVPSVDTKLTAAQELRAALLAKQKQQPKQWKQQLKAGKMVSAHVPKRFNRGG